ncbi:hypothetical protein NC652_021393 [Populus alba x Populus x berolinensis]|uniref:Uncharacterized protein n=1 Tax=Populus alba x Populus x berolinensis TaxID=444605 RepID=A0AAD6MMN2_9ROSI|nr:hypothetical protein NC652_021393 [Populus alba x Populus x berolinensis]KAJ6988137.1 hypothetical protein NC653_021156 [Populus alba x Populus x berolinensis]
MEQLGRPKPTRSNNKKSTLDTRAALAGSISERFGSEIIDEPFDRYLEKFVEYCLFSDPSYLPKEDSFVLRKGVNI